MNAISRQPIRFFDYLHMFWALMRMTINPKDPAPLFKVRSFRNHKSVRIALESILQDKNSASLIRARYRGAEMSKEHMANLPEGSLGRMYSEFMVAHKLEREFYGEFEDKIDDDLAYIRLRGRKTHDFHHVVLGLPPSELGEVAIATFYLSQNKIPLGSFVLVVAFLTAFFKSPEKVDDLMDAIIYGWQQGKKSPGFFGIKWEEKLAEPLEEIRAELNVIPSSKFNLL